MSRGPADIASRVPGAAPRSAPAARLPIPTRRPDLPLPGWLPWRVLLYLLLAVGLTWPAAAQLGQAVPGAERTDLHNALWSFWFTAQALADGALPWHTTLLDPPAGGVILVADPLGALLTLPLVPLVGLPTSYTLLVLFQLVLAGWAAHRFAAELASERSLPAEAAGLVAGVAYASAPILRAAVHNGSSEGIGGGWAMLAAWACWRVARDGGAWPVLRAAGALFLAAAGSWYGGVVAFLFAGVLLVLGLPGRWWATLPARASALVLGIALVLPLALATRAAASQPDNLVRIKNPRELASVRRSTGPADPLGFVAPGDFRSPDFRRISRYGEQFFHCHYLGFVVLLGAGASLRRRDGSRSGAVGVGFLWLGSAAGLVLAMGPVVVHDGAPVVVFGDRVIGMPWFLVEGLPGFSSLSLLYRLTQAPALGLALLAGLGAARAASGRNAGLIAAGVASLVLLEGRFMCPLGSLPDTADTRLAPALHALADAPPGVVLNHPVVGGRAYLYEQTVHGKPMAGTLNFPNNALGMKAWSALQQEAARLGADPDPDALAAFRARVADRARATGVRYVVAHEDPYARPDVQDDAVAAIAAAFPPTDPDAGDASVKVYRLW